MLYDEICPAEILRPDISVENIAIKKIIPNLKMTRHNSEKRKYVIPSLLECRRFFSENYGIDFKEDNQF